MVRRFGTMIVSEDEVTIERLGRSFMQYCKDPGKPKPFDVDKHLIEEVMAKHPIEDFVNKLKAAGKVDEKLCQEFGKDIVNTTAELADTKYLDRGSEVIIMVADHLKLSFPDIPRRYIELSLMASRPRDRWASILNCLSGFTMQASSCSVFDELQKAGLKLDDMPCRALCLQIWEEAAKKAGVKMKTEMTKTMLKDGLCEFAATSA